MGENLWDTSKGRLGGLNIDNLKVELNKHEVENLLPFKISYFVTDAIEFDELDTWCNEHLTGKFLCAYGHAQFESKEDKSLFLLKWGTRARKGGYQDV